jgi:ParB-like chromosome segregation protein Spo0J
MKIQEIEISKLKPAAYNPRKISAKELAMFVKSIDEYGFVEPVVVNKDMTVIWKT